MYDIYKKIILKSSAKIKWNNYLKQITKIREPPIIDYYK